MRDGGPIGGAGRLKESPPQRCDGDVQALVSLNTIQQRGHSHFVALSGLTRAESH